MSTCFRTLIQRTAEAHGSNIVLALDYIIRNRKKLYCQSLELLELLAPHICAIKVNRHLILPLGLFPYVKKLVKVAHNLKLPVIMDCKINDIGDTNLEIARHYFNADFDAITANPFIGWEGGLEPIFRIAGESNKGILLLIYMSHKGAYEGYGQLVQDSQTGSVLPQYLVFAKKALRWGADGVIVGATHPNIVRDVNRCLVNQIPIYSPGIGVQGGRLQSALTSGTRYLIIGRSILNSSDPLKRVKELKITSKRLLRP